MVRQDYILRLIEQLGRMLRELLRLRAGGRHMEALLAIVQQQEKLFGRPAAQIAPLTLVQQVDLLVLDEPPPSAVRKCIIHARLLAEAAHSYRALENADAVTGAVSAAAEVLRLARERFPAAYDEASATDLKEMLATLAGEGVAPG